MLRFLSVLINLCSQFNDLIAFLLILFNMQVCLLQFFSANAFLNLKSEILVFLLQLDFMIRINSVTFLPPV